MLRAGERLGQTGREPFDFFSTVIRINCILDEFDIATATVPHDLMIGKHMAEARVVSIDDGAEVNVVCCHFHFSPFV